MGRVYESTTTIQPIKQVKYSKLTCLNVNIGDKVLLIQRHTPYTIVLNDFELMFYDTDGLMFTQFLIMDIIEMDYGDYQDYRFIIIYPIDDEEIDGVDKIEIICFAIIIDDNEALILNSSKLYYEFNELLELGEPYDIGLNLRFAYLNKGEQINYNLKVN